jgi:hypothetical protein
MGGLPAERPARQEVGRMSTGTIMAVVLMTAALVLMAVLNRRAERKEFELRRGQPKRREGDPPWKDP